MSATAFTRRFLPLVALLASGVFWIAPHPPMVDLPQHAAQVVLLQQLLAGTSPWSSEFTINWLTPYLIGYGIALPLASLLPVAAALKGMLSVAYLAFVFMCSRVRRHVGADPRLDWYFLIGFFGFVYEWGFFTFMIAAPIVLAFIIAASRQANDPGPRHGAVVAGLGAVLLVSHGMSFMYALAIGLAFTAAAGTTRQRRLHAAWPYALMLVGAALLLWNGKRLEAQYATPDPNHFDWGFGWHRLPDLAATAIAGDYRVSVPAALVLVLAPWGLGLRVDWRRTERWIPFAVTTALLLFLPFFAMRLAFIHNRFGLFLVASYAWMFTAPVDARLAAGGARRLVLPLVVSLCAGLLALHAVQAWRFARETAGFDAMIARLDAGKRGLGMIYEPFSPSVGYAAAYYHYPVWYEVERGGLVEFNFAWFYVQVVRFRPERMPPLDYAFDPRRFDWATHGGSRFDYFFVRRAGGAPPDLFEGATCEVRLVDSAPPWFVYQRGTCR